MADTKAKPRRRWRFVLLALVLLGGCGALVLRHYAQPEKLTALLIAQAQSRFGLELLLRGDADFGFVPRLHLRLPQPRAKSGDDTLLDADSIDVLVPWHTLWGERVDIERIEIERPRVDLDALSSWLAARPASDSATPDVRFAVKIGDGVLLRDGKPVAEGLQLQFANAGDLAAWLAQIREPTSTLLPPLAGKAEADRVQIGSTRIEGLRIDVRDDDSTPEQ